MAVLGKVAASAISNENTLALANITFDFSLFKVDAPKVNPDFSTVSCLEAQAS